MPNIGDEYSFKFRQRKDQISIKNNNSNDNNAQNVSSIKGSNVESNSNTNENKEKETTPIPTEKQTSELEDKKEELSGTIIHKKLFFSGQDESETLQKMMDEYLPMLSSDSRKMLASTYQYTVSHPTPRNINYFIDSLLELTKIQEDERKSLILDELIDASTNVSSKISDPVGSTSDFMTFDEIKAMYSVSDLYHTTVNNINKEIIERNESGLFPLPENVTADSLSPCIVNVQSEEGNFIDVRLDENNGFKLSDGTTLESIDESSIKLVHNLLNDKVQLSMISDNSYVATLSNGTDVDTVPTEKNGYLYNIEDDTVENISIINPNEADEYIIPNKIYIKGNNNSSEQVIYNTTTNSVDISGFDNAEMSIESTCDSMVNISDSTVEILPDKDGIYRLPDGSTIIPANMDDYGENAKVYYDSKTNSIRMEGFKSGVLLVGENSSTTIFDIEDCQLNNIYANNNSDFNINNSQIEYIYFSNTSGSIIINNSTIGELILEKASFCNIEINDSTINSEFSIRKGKYNNIILKNTDLKTFLFISADNSLITLTDTDFADFNKNYISIEGENTKLRLIDCENIENLGVLVVEAEILTTDTSALDSEENSAISQIGQLFSEDEAYSNEHNKYIDKFPLTGSANSKTEIKDGDKIYIAEYDSDGNLSKITYEDNEEKSLFLVTKDGNETTIKTEDGVLVQKVESFPTENGQSVVKQTYYDGLNKQNKENETYSYLVIYDSQGNIVEYKDVKGYIFNENGENFGTEGRRFTFNNGRIESGEYQNFVTGATAIYSNFKYSKNGILLNYTSTEIYKDENGNELYKLENVCDANGKIQSSNIKDLSPQMVKIIESFVKYNLELNYQNKSWFAKIFSDTPDKVLERFQKALDSGNYAEISRIFEEVVLASYINTDDDLNEDTDLYSKYGIEPESILADSLGNMAKSISEYKELQSISQDEQNEVIDNIESYIGTQVETMLRYLELTYNGMGVIDKLSSFISNIISIIIPLGTSYNDAVAMIKSWGERASELGELYRNGNMPEFLALFKSITGMDFSQENILKLQVTNEIMTEYSNFTYEESINFVSENGIVPDIDLPNHVIIIMAERLGIISKEEMDEYFRKGYFELQNEDLSDLLCKVSIAFYNKTEEEKIKILTLNDGDFEYSNYIDFFGDNGGVTNILAYFGDQCYSTIREFRKFEQEVEKLPIEIILRASMSSVGNSKVSGQAVTNYEKTVEKYTKFITTTVTVLSFSFGGIGAAGALAKGAIGAITNVVLNGLNDATSSDGLTIENVLKYAIDGFMSGSFSDLGKFLASKLGLTGFASKYFKNWISITGKDLVKQLLMNPLLFQKDIDIEDVLETILIDSFITFGVTGLEIGINSVCDTLSKTTRIQNAIKSNNINIDNLPDSKAKTILQKIIEGEKLTFDEKAIFYKNFKMFKDFAEGKIDDLSEVVADIKFIQVVQTAAKTGGGDEAKRKGKNFFKSFIKGGLTWYWSVGSSDIDMTGGVIDEETIKKSKDWLKV